MNIFQIKTKPHGIERFNEFISENFICIGWPGIGNLQHENKDEIRTRLENRYNIIGHKLGNALGQVNTFVNTMKKDDVVLIGEREWAYIGIVGDYKYEQCFDNDIDGMCHRRTVEWINKILIKDLNSSIQKLLSNRNTICQYPETIKSSELDAYIKKQSHVSVENSLRLEELFSNALDVLEAELKSEDPERRLKAATELIRLKNR